MEVVIWGAPGLHGKLVEAGIRIADQQRARSALVRVESEADLHVVRRLRAERPGLPVVVVVANGPLALEAIELGAAGVLGDNATAADVAVVFEQVAAGQVVIPPSGALMVMQALRARGQARARFVLTSRERDVLAELIAGLTTAEIASRLGISFGTVQTHLKNLYRKLDVTSKAAATAVALRHRLV